MPKLAILVPASPTDSFFSQIAALNLAFKRLPWTRWEPYIQVCFGGAGDAGASDRWEPYFKEVTVAFASDSGPDKNPFHYAQIDGLFRAAPADADVYLRMDADTLPVRPFEDLLDYVVSRSCVAGVMAHFAFPASPGMSPREAWQRAADDLISEPLDFRQSYSLTDASTAADSRVAPFYINDGAVFIAKSAFGEFAARYLDLRPKLMRRLFAPYYSGQIALALAVTQMRVPTFALPMRYNFPNDSLAEQRFPQELDHVCIFHYLRTHSFDRQLIFSDKLAYEKFLTMPLSGVNKSFRDHVAELIGMTLPFDVEIGRRYPNAATSEAAEAPVKFSVSAAYEAEMERHSAKIASELKRIENAIKVAGPAELDFLVAERVILLSGLFDADYYLERNPDVRNAGVDPLWHYVRAGEKEGRFPNPFFSPVFYKRHSNPVLSDACNALQHYIEEGERQGRRPAITFDPHEYRATNGPLVGSIDRPLTHFLKIGRSVGLGPRRALSAASLGVGYLEQLEASGRGSLELLMKAKQALIASFGIETGFEIFKEVSGLPHCDRVKEIDLESQYRFAIQHGETFVETAPSGEPFVIEAPRVIGESDSRPLKHKARAHYVTSFRDARVRGRSAVIQVEDVALLDFEPWELELFDCELDIDPTVFHATKRKVRLTLAERDDSSQFIEEGFMLLGPQSGAFGDWMVEYLPRYVAALQSGALPSVPVLVDAALPPVHREMLALMMPEETVVIDVPAYEVVGVHRLWRAPSLHYAPARETMNRRFKFDYVVASPARIAPVVREIARRAATALQEESRTSPERLFLARERSTWRRLVNHGEIAAAAEAHGFVVACPDDLDLAGQVNLLKKARFIVSPEGSSIYLGYFAPRGAQMCILNHPLVQWPTAYNSYLGGVGVNITILTGPFARQHSEFPYRADYTIDVSEFRRFLDEWIANTDGR